MANKHRFGKASRTAGFALAAGMVFSLCSTAHAAPDARKMTCKQVHKLIARKGAAVINTSRYTYARYVINTGFCDPYDIARSYWIKTRTGKCQVKKCEDASIYYPFMD